jgi:hypothetical protein
MILRRFRSLRWRSGGGERKIHNRARMSAAQAGRGSRYILDERRGSNFKHRAESIDGRRRRRDNDHVACSAAFYWAPIVGVGATCR